MIVNKRTKAARKQNRPDLIPKKLTRRQALEAFDFECDLRKGLIDKLDSTSDAELHQEDAI